MTQSADPIEEQKRQVLQHMEVEWSGHATAQAIADTFTAPGECWFDAVAFDTRFDPLTAYSILTGALPDVSGVLTGAWDVAGVSLREVTLSGHQKGEYLGVPGTGEQVSFEAFCIFEFDMVDGVPKLRGERVYYDNYGIYEQMTKPGTKTGVGLAERYKDSPLGPADASDAVIAQQQAQVTAHANFENEHEWPDVVGTFVQGDSAFFDAVALSSHQTGVAGVKGSYDLLSGALPDLHVEVVRGWDVPGFSFREVVLTGHQSGAYGVVPASGKPVCFKAALVFQFDVSGDTPVLLGERVYYDNLTVLQQLGAVPAGGDEAEQGEPEPA